MIKSAGSMDFADSKISCRFGLAMRSRAIIKIKSEIVWNMMANQRVDRGDLVMEVISSYDSRHPRQQLSYDPYLDK